MVDKMCFVVDMRESSTSAICSKLNQAMGVGQSETGRGPRKEPRSMRPKWQDSIRKRSWGKRSKEAPKLKRFRVGGSAGRSSS